MVQGEIPYILTALKREKGRVKSEESYSEEGKREKGKVSKKKTDI